MKRRTVMAAAAGAFAASALPLSRAAADDTRSQLASMTLDQKIGQVLWTHVFGASADDASMARKNQLAFGDDVRTPAQAVQKYHLGGVLYFNWSGNISTPTNPAAVAHLSNGLQEAARTSSTAPLAIAVDQEGGIVARITSPATEFPGNMALGAVNDPRAARAQGAVLGRELAALGINVDFAPDVDVNTNPANPVIGVRSMGTIRCASGYSASSRFAAFNPEGLRPPPSISQVMVIPRSTPILVFRSWSTVALPWSVTWCPSAWRSARKWT